LYSNFRKKWAWT